MIKDKKRNVKWAIGIDIGGTKIEAALIDKKGKVHDRYRIATKSISGYRSVLKHLITVVNAISTKNKLKEYVVGIGVAGQITKETGVIKYSPNLNWHNVKLKQDLSKIIKQPVYICNDVRAATFCEWNFGAGKGCDDLVCVFVGTGIGGGIVSGGHILEGSNNTAGEIGHMTIDIHGPKCHCNNTGCFEALAGGWAIARDAQNMVSKNRTQGKTLLHIAKGKINNINAKTVYEGLRQHDPLSKQLVDDLKKNLIAGMVSIVNAFGPKVLILGGGIIEGFPMLLPAIKKGIKKNALSVAAASLKVVPAKLHNDSGAIGAASFAFHELKR